MTDQPGRDQTGAPTGGSGSGGDAGSGSGANNAVTGSGSGSGSTPAPASGGGTPTGPVGGSAGGPRERPLPVPRPTLDVAPAERFTAVPSVHDTSMSPERAAQIVRQSSSARWIGFLATLVVVVFVILYYFYDLGVPGVANSSRLTAETNAQAVTAVEKGYEIYQANCARCHGVNGEGFASNGAPPLHDQSKLFVHLNETYIRAVLFSGGRYVCGNPKSLMPVWDSANGGPLNYQQINDLIAFIRSDSTQTFTVRDASTQEPVVDANGKVETFMGWRDPNYKPAPGATPFPDCWSSAFTNPTPSGGATAAPSGSAAGPVVKVQAQNIAFTTTDVSAPANTAFTINFDNEDAGTPHNIEIDDSTGASKFKGDVFTGVATQAYSVPALAAGTYSFKCDVHPNMTGTLTVK